MIKIFGTAVAAALLFAGPAFACEEISSQRLGLSACIDDADWELQAPQGAQEFLYFSADQRFGFTIITEKETIDLKSFRENILQNAAAGAGEGKTLDDVKINGERTEIVGGKSVNEIEYAINSSGTDLVFQNFYYVDKNYGSLQLVFWSIPADATAAAFRAGQILSTVKIK